MDPQRVEAIARKHGIVLLLQFGSSVTTIDRELVTRKLLLVTADLELLAAIRDKGLEAYLGSSSDQAGVERRLQRAVSRMIDIKKLIEEFEALPDPDRSERLWTRTWWRPPTISLPSSTVVSSLNDLAAPW